MVNLSNKQHWEDSIIVRYLSSLYFDKSHILIAKRGGDGVLNRGIIDLEKTRERLNNILEYLGYPALAIINRQEQQRRRSNRRNRVLFCIAIICIMQNCRPYNKDE